jgi:hypothetical protein
MKAIQGLDEVLVRSRVSNINAFVFASTSIVFADATNVFFFKDYGTFALLQSSTHTSWLEEYASTMKTDIRYTPATCFDTLPFPSAWAETEREGKSYYECRQVIQQTRKIGLTSVYHLLFDSDVTDHDIQRLRELHVEMDKAVAAAYGWDDLDLGHDFHETKQGVRFTISEAARREVLGRLLKLNHERYAEEVKQGLHDKKGKGRAGGKRNRKNSATSESVNLFQEGIDQ